MLVGAFAVSSGFEVDLVRVEVAARRKAAPRPVEVVTAWNVVVDVPLVVERVIFATVRVDKRFHKYQSIFKWVVLRLPAKKEISKFEN